MEAGNTVALQTNKPWQFQPGQSGNPLGKPKGARHFSTLFKEAIKKIDSGTGERTDLVIVKSVLAKAKKGDLMAVNVVREEIDGPLPKPIEEGRAGNTFNIVVMNFDAYRRTTQPES